MCTKNYVFCLQCYKKFKNNITNTNCKLSFRFRFSFWWRVGCNYSRWDAAHSSRLSLIVTRTLQLATK